MAGGGGRQMSTPVNKGEGGVKNAQNPVNVVYEQPLSVIQILLFLFLPRGFQIYVSHLLLLISPISFVFECMFSLILEVTNTIWCSHTFAK